MANKLGFTFVWDNTQKFINNIDCIPLNWYLSLKDLTHKLATVLALTVASIKSEVRYLNVKYILRSPHGYMFRFDKLTKSWWKGKTPPSPQCY